MAKAKKVDYRKLAMDAMNEVGVGFREGTKEFEAAVKYVEEHWELAQDKQAAKDLQMTVREYALNSVGNGIQDGHHKDYIVEDDEEDNPKGQEIIEVNQSALKKALQALVTRENDFLGYLYDMHAQYNEQYFYGQLSHPFITIDKMSNKTLGNYTHGEDAMGITNHIRFNRNFIALNQGENGDDPTRILETLRHEMIHQWQDEVLYMAQGVAKKQVMMPVGFGKYLDKQNPSTVKRDKQGRAIGELVDQKQRPKEWHNRDFKEYAVIVDIPAIGDKCYGNPAHMPEGKSYNRKYQCRCVASNDAPLTIWSTRLVNATCNVCKSKFIEQKKSGGTIQVVLSHVEAPGEDYMETKMKGKGFDHFMKFKSKKEQTAFVDAVYANDKGDGLEVEQGFYLKGNNAYKEGFTHWVAYKGEALKGLPKKESKPAPKKQEPKKPAPKKQAPKVEKPVVKPVEPTPSEEPQIDPAPKKADTKEKPKAKPAKAKKPAVKKPKAVEPKPAPQPEPKVEKPAEPEKEPDMGKVIPLPTAAAKRVHTNAEDLLAVYKETGSVKGAAEVFGMTSANIIYWAKKLGVDFKKGEIKDAVKS